MSRFLLTLPVFAVLLGCRSSETSKPPEQQGVVRAKPAPPTKAVIEMKDPAALDYIVRDIDEHLQSERWRWTFDHPELQFSIKSADKAKLEVDFAVAGATLKDTGPVTVKFLVNGHDAGTMKCPKDGDYHFVKPVAAALLNADGMNNVAMDVNPLWTAPQDGKHLGLILIRAGFTFE